MSLPRWICHQLCRSVASWNLCCFVHHVTSSVRRLLFGISGVLSTVVSLCAVDVAKALKVLLICPTGALVFAIQSLLPSADDNPNIAVDTLRGSLSYTRAKDQHNWSPPSFLRQYHASPFSLCKRHTIPVDTFYDLFNLVRIFTFGSLWFVPRCLPLP